MKDFRYDELICGLDFGYVNDPSAFIVAKVNLATKEIYIFDEFYRKQLLNDAIAKLIIEKGYGKEIIFADSAEQKSIEEIRRAGVQRIRPAAKGPGIRRQSRAMPERGSERLRQAGWQISARKKQQFP